MARRKFLSQVIYHKGGDVEDLWELRIVFSRRADQNLTTWNEIADSVDALMNAFVQSTAARNRFREGLEELIAEQAKRTALLAEFKELFKVLIQSEPAVVGKALYESLLEIEQDALFERKKPQLQPIELSRLKKLLFDVYEAYRKYRRSLR